MRYALREIRDFVWTLVLVFCVFWLLIAVAAVSEWQEWWEDR